MRNKFQAQDRSGWQGFFAFEVAKIVAQVQLHISSFCKYATRGRVSKQKKSEEEGEEEEEEGWLCFESQQGPSSP